MKIHRITTHNLNSLYGTQEVDLDEALGGASLFLIFGPTGSGKSTLMDAVSLALFGQTPRLDAKQGDRTRKPHRIMSRGTGACHAEVIFSKLESGLRQTYRARWACRRARGKAAGAFQKPERSLERRRPDGTFKMLASGPLAKHTKPKFAEVLEGFKVEDFNRSMLLAQGQFDAFLGADPAERAAILERLTDTSVYQQIGDRASRVRARHSQRVAQLRALAAAGGGLDAEALGALELAHADNAARLAGAVQDEARCASELAWFRDESTLLQSAAEVGERRHLLACDHGEAAAELAALAEYERCVRDDAFILLDGFHGADRRAQAGARRLAELQGALPGSRSRAAATGAEAATANVRAVQADLALETLRPLATEAASAVDRLAGVAQERGAARLKLAAATETAAKNRAALAACEEAQAQAESALQVASLDLAQHAGDDRFAAAWEPLRDALRQLEARLADGASEARALGVAQADHEAAGAALMREVAARELERAAAIGPLEQALRAATEALVARLTHVDIATTRTAAATAVAEARTALEALLSAQAPVQAAERQADAVSRGAQKLAAIDVAIGAAEATRLALQATVQRHQELGAATEVALGRVRRIAAVASHRATLAPEDRCPLCGALEHPYVDGSVAAPADATVQRELAEAEAEAGRHAASLRAARDALSVHRGELNTLRVQRSDLVAAQEIAESQLQILGLAAAHAVEGAGLRAGTDTVTLHEAVGEARAELARREEVLGGIEGAHRAADEARRRHDSEVARQLEIDADLGRRGAAQAATGDALAARQLAHTTSSEATEGERRRLRDLLGEHGLAGDGDDPGPWRIEGEARARAHLQRHKTAERCQREAAAARTSVASAVALLEQSVEVEGGLSEALSARCRDYEELQETCAETRAALAAGWAQVLDAESGEPRPDRLLPAPDAPASAFVEAQRAWLHTLTTAAREAAEASAAAQKELAGLEGSIAQTLAQSAGLEGERAVARAALDDVLRLLAIEGDVALAAVRLGPRAIDAGRALRSSLEARRVAIETQTKDVAKALTEHRGKRPASLPPEDAGESSSRAERVSVLEAALTAASATRSEAAEDEQQTRDALRDHAKAAADQQAHRQRLREAEAAARVWQQLHDLIGKNDGGAFKQFAQALNLGLLLGKANVHLARLNERYTLLPRIEDGLPTLEFDLGDRWQQGQRSSPRSLSGGERFLVSLALALGLSDFRSVKMPIETLLLDEGFGTLDPQTLTVALGALSQLQADGRQVGIISHVVGLRDGVPVRIEVCPLGSGRSEVRVHTEAASK